ncbi:hypothetical protein [Sphaerimonospora thailandensis]|uniref:Uncharacterized protein n=1 Tax=Sphaerimonospora thailandensis TaxID=795644 RepID=A0A8J3R9L5_9ACTN|nr:hypothetical protein [Sphaerimonospora thailandensis]GIH70296.1 hypothetical protein Mth01_25490 [Sphaerimonospora thailandensis]
MKPTSTPCMPWDGPVRDGLPILRGGRSARRAAYAAVHGDPGPHPIVTVCGTSDCVEPDHLATTLDARTHCGNRHPWRPETTRWRRRRGHVERDCLLCRAEQKARARDRRRYM